ncbi:MAG TPA: hypothetical protein VN894_10270 [Polyangiaceae bacterium]|nr:hypothetical protein [Polyangiaceae bacterium]
MLPADRRPIFSNGFPRTPALDALVEAFARGDYGRVRLEGRKLAGSAPDEDVRAAARSIVARTAPDPLALWLLALAAGLLVVLSAYWIIHGRPPAGAAPNAPRAGRGPIHHARSALGLV